MMMQRQMAQEPTTKPQNDVVLLHGWPGSPDDYRQVVSLLDGIWSVHIPELFVPGQDSAVGAHAERVLDLIRNEKLIRPVVAGYDVGSRIAQAVARLAPDKIGGIVVTPAYPGIGDRALAPQMQARYWYQHFNRLNLAVDLLDGNEAALRTYLGHIWRTWSGDPHLASGEAFDRLINRYARPGAFRASVDWYRANRIPGASEVIHTPTVMLWPDGDELFPVEWADRVNEWFDDVRLVVVPECGHFVPLQAPEVFVEALRQLRNNWSDADGTASPLTNNNE